MCRCLRLVEVNTCPDLSASSPLDRAIKGALFSDVFNLVGSPLVNRPARVAAIKEALKRESRQQGDRAERVAAVGGDQGVRARGSQGRDARSRSRHLAPGEKAAWYALVWLHVGDSHSVSLRPFHTHNTHTHTHTCTLHTPRYEELTAAEISLIQQCEDEFRRQECTQFERIYPDVDLGEAFAPLFETQVLCCSGCTYIVEANNAYEFPGDSEPACIL